MLRPLNLVEARWSSVLTSAAGPGSARITMLLDMYRTVCALLLAASLVLCTSATFAADAGFGSCPQFFPGKPPLVSEESRLAVRELCFDAFAVLYSGVSKTPVFAVERLTRDQLADARDERRTGRFFADARLRSKERATLDDYRGSGFDRGHMAPAADMQTAQAMAQSFSLANMVPQSPENNRGAWAKSVEKATRKYVQRTGGPVYVFTGPVFPIEPQTIGPGHVWVPQYLYKLVYDSKANRAWAHWIENSDHARGAKPISYRELVSRTGIEFLPGKHPGS